MTRARPFPFEALERISRDEIERTRALRRISTRLVRSDAVARVLSDLTSEHVEIRLQRARKLDLARVPHDAVAVALSPADAPGMSRAIVVDAEVSLAAAIVSRAMRQRAPRVLDASRAATPALAGAFSGVVFAAARRMLGGSALSVVAAGPSQAIARDLAGAHRDVSTAWLTVVLGDETFAARISVPTSLALDAGAETFSADSLARLGEAPIALPIVAATCLTARTELMALTRGDAFVVPSFGLRTGGAKDLEGPVALVAPRSEMGISADLAAGGRLVLRGLLESHPWEPRAPSMSGDEQENSTVVAVEDAPIVVRVELGAVEMKAREWAELAPGDVVSLGRKVGDPAILRVGGVEVARGELVQIDDEYGVRILAREGAREGGRR